MRVIENNEEVALGQNKMKNIFTIYTLFGSIFVAIVIDYTDIL